MDRPINGRGHAANPAITLAALAVTVVLWSSAFVAIRAALESYNASHLAVFRFVVASVVMGALSIRRGMSLPSRRELYRVIAIGAIGITGYNLALNYGEMDVTAAAASFLVNTVPIITALIALVAGQERLSALGWLGSLVSFAGVSMVAIGEEGAVAISIGAALVLLAAVFQSAFFVLQKPLLTKYGSLRVMTWAIWVGTLLLLPLGGGLATAIPTAPAEGTLAIVYLGMFPGAIGYVTWAYVLKHMPVARASTYLYAIPPLTMLIGWLWLREMPSLLSILGGSLALGGVVIVNSFQRRVHAPVES